MAGQPKIETIVVPPAGSIVPVAQIRNTGAIVAENEEAPAAGEGEGGANGTGDVTKAGEGGSTDAAGAGEGGSTDAAKAGEGEGGDAAKAGEGDKGKEPTEEEKAATKKAADEKWVRMPGKDPNWLCPPCGTVWVKAEMARLEKVDEGLRRKRIALMRKIPTLGPMISAILPEVLRGNRR